MSEVCVMYTPPFPPPYDGIESAIFRCKPIRAFLDKIRQKDIDIAVRDLWLLGIEVFKDRNPTLTHFSINEIQRWLHNYIEESKKYYLFDNLENTKDYYHRMNPSSTDEEYEDEDKSFENKNFYKTNNPSFDNSLNSRSHSRSKSRTNSWTKSKPNLKKNKNKDKNIDIP